jgi:uncharacterized protein YbcI
MSADGTTPVGELRAEISRAIVRLLHEHTGRGPTRARTYLDDDLVTVVLRDTLTPAEQRLVQAGEGVAVLELRHKFQLTMRDDCVAAIERITGRKVEAFMSANHIDPDMGAELFVLAAA